MGWIDRLNIPAAVVGGLLFATVFCFVQNFLGIGIARAFGENPLLGVMAGSVTLVGGPATGLAFAPLFETAGLTGRGARDHGGDDRDRLRWARRRAWRR